VRPVFLCIRYYGVISIELSVLGDVVVQPVYKDKLLDFDFSLNNVSFLSSWCTTDFENIGFPA